MAVILGVDLGTSSIKVMLLDSETGVIDVAAICHDVEIPSEGFAEQTTEVWWEGLKRALNILKKKYPKEFEQIAAVGYSGQMHGIVLLDTNGKSLRPAILWLDQRSKKQLEEIDNKLSLEEMGECLRNRVFTGFGFPSLLWVKENEPEVYDKIAYVLMPKDYLRFRMTGKIATEVSDASSSVMFDVPKRNWAYPLIKRLGLKENIFPECHESTDIAGYITEECSNELGLKPGIPVVYGSGDQQAQSVGNGVCHGGEIIANIGTGGQIAAFIERPLYDKKLRTHTFCHAISKAYTIYGAALTSGMSQKWLKNSILSGCTYEDLDEMASEIAPCSDGLLYLPYLSGERTPHMNPDAKGAFFGLTLNQDRRYLSRAVLEGVTFSLKDSLTIIEELGIQTDTIIASGGGAKSPLWLQIQADIFEKPIKVCKVNEQACMGACIIAGVGTGIFRDVREAIERLVVFDEKEYMPNQANFQSYRHQYKRFRDLYEATKNLM